MQIIIDANVIISMLIKPGKPIDLFLIEDIKFLAPRLLFEEIEQNKELIIIKMRETVSPRPKGRGLKRDSFSTTHF